MSFLLISRVVRFAKWGDSANNLTSSVPRSFLLTLRVVRFENVPLLTKSINVLKPLEFTFKVFINGPTNSKASSPKSLAIDVKSSSVISSSFSSKELFI